MHRYAFCQQLRTASPISTSLAPAVRRIDFRKPDPQPAMSSQQDRQVRRIDLRQVPQDVDQSTQAARDGQVHSFPHHRLRLWIAVGVARGRSGFPCSLMFARVELFGDVNRMIVATLVDFVPLERRPDEYRQK